MKNDLIRAKALLNDGSSCAACKGGSEYTANGRGIAPLISIIERSGGLSGFTVCDKIVGSAAAYLLIEAKAGEVYAVTASERAVKLLTAYGVTVSYTKLTDFIKNRSGDGLCPMEQTALKMDSPYGAYEIFKAKLNELKNENNS